MCVSHMNNSTDAGDLAHVDHFPLSAITKVVKLIPKVEHNTDLGALISPWDSRKLGLNFQR
jgi:hypothetical protein